MADEYIRREDAVEETLKYIISSGVSNQSTWNECVRTIADTLQDMPPADVVPVVRCRECIYQKPDTIYGGDWCWVHREPFMLETLDGFCSHGERREE